MFNIYLISQLLVIIAYIICGIAFLQKNKTKILILVSIFNALILIQYSLLNATMGMIANAINILRNFIFIINLKLNKPNSKILLILFLLSTIALALIFYTTPIDIFPCIITLISTFSYWINNTKVLRICNVFCSLSYIIYALPLKSYTTIIAETYLIITTIIGYIKHEKNNSLSLKQL